jgi:DNA-binding beta-propeller fold protein YncE
VWLEGSISPITPNFDSLKAPFSLFVTITGDIYVDNGKNNRVDKSTLNAARSTTVMYVTDQCHSLFIDINDNLYCCINSDHQVIKKSLKDPIENPSTIVAGTGSEGSLSNMLDNPRGIFVDINFDLYVADSNNNRIQLFKSGELNGITVAGDGAPQTITLSEPSGMVLDADKYLFIVDRDYHRIIGSGPNGFRCLVGCSTILGLAPHQLYGPFTLSFDSYGNMFVADQRNNRIQKFFLSTNSCSKCLKIFK